MRWWFVGSLLVGLGVMLAAPAYARHPVLDWMEGLVRWVEPEFRELSLLDYRTGIST